MNGWIDVGNSIAALNASDANIGITLGGLQIEISANYKDLKTDMVILLNTMLNE